MTRKNEPSGETQQLPLFEFDQQNLDKLSKHQPSVNGKENQFSKYIVYDY